jgi:hypothetical protein
MSGMMRACWMLVCWLCWWTGAANALTDPNTGLIVPDEANIAYGDCPVAVHDVQTNPPSNTCELTNACVLDLYMPPDGAPIDRVLVFVHGGTWMTGSKDNLIEAQALLSWFTQRGYMLAGIEFRQVNLPVVTVPGQPPLPPVITYADSATDVANAVAWVVSNRDTYHVKNKDPVLLGYSSGAHLVSLITTDGRYLDSAGSKDNKIAAAILLDDDAYDVPKALESIAHNLQVSVTKILPVPATPPLYAFSYGGLGMNIPLLKYVFGSTNAEQLAGSPSAYLAAAKHVPPTYLLSADLRGTSTTPLITRGSGVPANLTVPLPSWYTPDFWSKGEIAYQTTDNYYNLLIKAGVDATHVHLPQRNHESLVQRYLRDTDDGDNQGPSDGVQQFLDRLGL